VGVGVNQRLLHRQVVVHERLQLVELDGLGAESEQALLVHPVLPDLSDGKGDRGGDGPAGKPEVILDRFAKHRPVWRVLKRPLHLVEDGICHFKCLFVKLLLFPQHLRDGPGVPVLPRPQRQ